MSPGVEETATPSGERPFVITKKNTAPTLGDRSGVLTINGTRGAEGVCATAASKSRCADTVERRVSGARRAFVGDPARGADQGQQARFTNQL